MEDKRKIRIYVYIIICIYVLSVACINLNYVYKYVIQLSNFGLLVLMCISGLVLYALISGFNNVCCDYENHSDKYVGEEIEFEVFIIFIAIVLLLIASFIISFIWTRSWLPALSPLIITVFVFMWSFFFDTIKNIFSWLLKIKKKKINFHT